MLFPPASSSPSPSTSLSCLFISPSPLVVRAPPPPACRPRRPLLVLFSHLSSHPCTVFTLPISLSPSPQTSTHTCHTTLTVAVRNTPSPSLPRHLRPQSARVRVCVYVHDSSTISVRFFFSRNDSVSAPLLIDAYRVCTYLLNLSRDRFFSDFSSSFLFFLCRVELVCDVSLVVWWVEEGRCVRFSCSRGNLPPQSSR